MEELKVIYENKLRQIKAFLYNGNDTPLVRLELAILEQVLADINKTKQ